MPAPREIDAFLTDLKAAVRSIDPTIDTEKGPIATMLYGVAVAGAQSESFSAYLQRLYQFSNVTLINDEDMFELALNFAKDPNIAKVARVIVHFYRLTRPEPGRVYVASVGTRVSTDDGRFNFIVVEDASMNGDIADVYFNAEVGRYEIPVSCEAVAAGADYNLPPNTINTIQTVQESFDGCINRDYAAKQGEEELDKFGVQALVWNALQGVNQDTAGQIESIITDIDPTGVDDYVTVPSTDFAFFARLNQMSTKLGYDIYMISDQLQVDIDRGTALGGETFLPLSSKPVSTVRYVSVDGTVVPHSLDKDVTAAWRGSPLANDRVELATPLQPGQVWEVQYFYYNVIQDVHNALQDRIKVFGSDTLGRLADTVSINVAGEVSVFTTAERADVIEDIRTYTDGYLRNPDNPSIAYRTFVTLLDPLDYQRSVEANVDGVQQFRLTRFARDDGAVLPIEQISLNGKTEYPVLALDFDVT